ncbi:MAG: H-NS histone family protein [Delftia acidovorans]|jgi:DNA-binding protein H-NS|uniref:H-NS histone family protein n=1 Tax=Delftia acidovorans TaxID=80866 RepID=UPI0028271E6E|nr:H-NS histone family protein [Delftia acidovorans]
MTADYKTLLRQKAELEARIAETLKTEKAGVITRVRELVEQFGLTQDDVFSTGKPKKVSIGVAKYRDPATGVTWTGRGKPPRWIEGKDRKSFEI